jgi:hypothetical protein
VTEECVTEDPATAAESASEKVFKPGVKQASGSGYYLDKNCNVASGG